MVVNPKIWFDLIFLVNCFDAFKFPRTLYLRIQMTKWSLVWVIVWGQPDDKKLSMVTVVVNSLTPGRFEIHFRKVIFQLISVIDGWSISCKILLKLMPMDLTDGKSTLVPVMAWCRQATSHYLSQCWPRSMPPCGITRPQWVNSLWPSDTIWGLGIWSSLTQAAACHHLFNAKRLPEPIMT